MSVQSLPGGRGRRLLPHRQGGGLGPAGRGAAALLLLVAAGLPGVGCTTPGELRVRSLVLVDEEGFERGRLWVTEGRAQFRLTPRQGSAQILMSVDRRGEMATVTVTGREGTPTLTLGTVGDPRRMGLVIGNEIGGEYVKLDAMAAGFARLVLDDQRGRGFVFDTRAGEK